MQMQVPVHRLKHALELVEPAVARGKVTLPILANVLFRGGKLRATNLELSVSADLAEASGDAFTLPYKTLTDVLRHIPNAEVATLERDGGKVTLTSGGTRVTLFSTDAGEFPPTGRGDIDGEGELVDGDRFVKALVGAVPYTATDKQTARPVLQAVCVALGDPIEVAAGDGFRLAWQAMPLALLGAGSGVKQLLVPRNSVQALERLWKRAVKPPSSSGQPAFSNFRQGASSDAARTAVARRMMRVRMTAGGASFHFGEATLYTQLLTGEFPNYQQLIPQDLPRKVTFDAEAAYRVVRMLAPMSAGKQGSNTLRLEWTDQAMQLSARSEEWGEVSGTVAVTTRGEPGSIAFNVRYLLEFLAGKHGLVLMECNLPSNPARFTHAGSPNLVLMPMFVKDGAPSPASNGAAEPPEVETPEEPEDDLPQEGPTLEDTAVDTPPAKEPDAQSLHQGVAAEAAPPAPSSRTRRGGARRPRS